MEEIKPQYNVFMTSDLHVGHKNILRHSPNRIEAMGLSGPDDVKGHDEWIKRMWLDTVKRGDHVYVLGDFIMSGSDYTNRYLHAIKSTGCHIHLIVGNHDKSTQNLTNMFNSIDLIKVVDFKKTAFPFLEEDFPCVLCHYPMKSWPRKCHGSMNLYGHVHNNSPWIDEGDDLCLNVGLDSPFANHNLIPLEKIYEYYKNKLGGLKPEKFIKKITQENSTFIR